jgi:hypothetical protein
VTRERGQLVVLAAAALAIALVPMAFAYLQLGYNVDVQTATVDEDRIPSVERTLTRSLVTASSGVPGSHDWSNRSAAVDELRERLQSTVRSLQRAGLDDGTAVRIAYNDTRARALADANCPTGPDRAFGSCLADRGVVVQERDGRTHVLGIAVDVTVTRPDGSTSTTTVIGAPVADPE